MDIPKSKQKGSVIITDKGMTNLWTKVIDNH